jgi:hypothetical protein
MIPIWLAPFIAAVAMATGALLVYLAMRGREDQVDDEHAVARPVRWRKASRAWTIYRPGRAGTADEPATTAPLVPQISPSPLLMRSTSVMATTDRVDWFDAAGRAREWVTRSTAEEAAQAGKGYEPRHAKRPDVLGGTITEQFTRLVDDTEWTDEQVDELATISGAR